MPTNHAEGIFAAHAAALLNGTFRGDAYPTPFPACYIKFHIDHPGPDGTLSPAAHTTRYLCTFATPASTVYGAITNTASFLTNSVSVQEPWPYCTFWTALTGGTGFWSGTVGPGAITVQSGTQQTIAVGAIVAQFGIAF